MYDKNKKFYLIVDICEISNPSIKDSYKLVKFIKEIKKKNPQYLKKSILILNDSYILKKLMGFAFKITSPAAPLYLYWKKMNEMNVNNNTIQEIFETQNDKFQQILP